MKCDVYFSFSLFISINTPHDAIFAFHFHVGSLLYEIMYQFFFFSCKVLELMKFYVYNVDMYISCVFPYICP